MGLRNSGNENDDACKYSPSSTPAAITVGSIKQGDVKSSFSNHGACVDIHAPGSLIRAAWAESDKDVNTISGLARRASFCLLFP